MYARMPKKQLSLYLLRNICGSREKKAYIPDNHIKLYTEIISSIPLISAISIFPGRGRIR
jgi:hypothetical protein